MTLETQNGGGGDSGLYRMHSSTYHTLPTALLILARAADMKKSSVIYFVKEKLSLYITKYHDMKTYPVFH
jgi:hypothetical protein